MNVDWPIDNNIDSCAVINDCCSRGGEGVVGGAVGISGTSGPGVSGTTGGAPGGGLGIGAGSTGSNHDVNCRTSGPSITPNFSRATSSAVPSMRAS